VTGMYLLVFFGINILGFDLSVLIHPSGQEETFALTTTAAASINGVVSTTILGAHNDLVTTTMRILAT